MSGQGQLLLVQRFRPPDAACDEKTYTEYVEHTIANEVTCSELAEIMGYFACGAEEVVRKIVKDKFASAGKVLRKR